MLVLHSKRFSVMENVEIVKSKMANALTSADSNHIIAVADDVYDDDKKKYQSEINDQLMAGKIYKEGAWVSNTSDPTAATTDKLGGIKVAGVREGNVETTAGGSGHVDRYYGVELDKDGKAFVYVPWTLTVYPTASNTTLGVVRTGYNTGIKVEGDVIKADFDTTDYSEEGDITAIEFSPTKVASPNTVNQIVDAKLQKAIYDVLNTPI